MDVDCTKLTQLYALSYPSAMIEASIKRKQVQSKQSGGKLQEAAEVDLSE
jgi:hypothetical protein